MTTTDISLGKFEITAQLFELIDGLPAEKQFILLKRLLGADLPGHLMRMVLDLTEAQRVELLKALGAETGSEQRVKTISLDEADNLMRGNLRKRCRLPVRLKTAEKTHACTIVDISPVGVFIKSHTRHASGKKIQMLFALPTSKEPIKILGKTVRSTPAGVGVEFLQLSDAHAEAIQAYCKSP